MSDSFEISSSPKSVPAWKFAGGFVLLLYIIHVANWAIGLLVDLRQFGIVPRSISGLFGIALAPLLHGDLGHLASNTVPLFILTTVLFSRAAYKPASALAGIWILGGLMTWAFARGYAVHIGASGVIYGIAAFIVAAGFRMKDLVSIAVGIVIAIVYSSLIFGLMPSLSSGTSWEGHLFGAIAGVIMAFTLHGKKRRDIV